MAIESERQIHSPYRLEDFDYPLPPELIAQRPLRERDASRLLVVHRRDGRWEDRHFKDLGDYLGPSDALVLNDTKVFPARLLAKKPTGGKVEILLLGLAGKPGTWRVLLQPALREGQEIRLPSGENAFYRGRDSNGTALVEFAAADVRGLAARWGSMPLPPYIRRESEPGDARDYQTVYARREGAVAAPTAGLHFTTELMESLRVKGVEILSVTLHVGYGTFKPVADPSTHRMHAEDFVLDPRTADRISRAMTEKRKICAVGTTTARVLETCALGGRVMAGEGQTDLFIYPPAEFEAVNALVTNFHLPRSTLLMLVGAFCGMDLMKKAYRHAVETKYRFYSYGDAMLIL